jgi:hypothetical protein
LCSANSLNFVVFFMYALILSAYSPNKIKYFSRILFRRLDFVGFLRTRRKSKEYTERNFYFRQCVTKLKGQYFEKIKYGIINWPTRNKFQIFLLGIFNLKSSLSHLTVPLICVNEPSRGLYCKCFCGLFMWDRNGTMVHT